MTDSHISTLLRLRLLVGYLGEKAQFAWWPTKFYEASSRQFLEPVFAKTSGLAQYHGVLEAARRLHDEHLNVGSYHLFRLPEEVEQDLHAMMLSVCQRRFSPADSVQFGAAANSVGGRGAGIQAPESKEAALDSLKSLAGIVVPVRVGPASIGSIKSLGADETLTLIAAGYLSAFTANMKSYPYLVG